MRIRYTIALSLTLWAVGCAPDEELRLVLAEVEPDPIEGAATLRVTFDPGTGERDQVDLDLVDGGADGGLSGESIADLEIEALDSLGRVLARGHRGGDLTPAQGEVREETVLLLRAGVFSTVAELVLDRARADACASAVDAETVLVAGGGEASVALLDLEVGAVSWGSAALSGFHVGCQAATLADGRTAVATDDDDKVDLIGVGGGLDRAYNSGRIGGALTAVGDGEALWWMGGEEVGGDLTSQLHAVGGTWDEGPDLVGQARLGHAAICPPGGERCAVLGSVDAPAGWLHVEVVDVLAGGGSAIGFGAHDQAADELPGQARHAVALGPDHVAAITEVLDESYLVVLDLSEDGQAVLVETLPAGLVGAALAATGDGGVLVVGGRDDAGISGTVRLASDAGGAWSSMDLDVPLVTPREGAATATLADGRIVVVGGRDADGERMDSIEVYQPE
jgi:hypothetical protein